MINSFYTAATATVQTQQGMDVLANNVANVSTTGYKESTVSFSDLLYTNVEGGSQTGHGTRLEKTDTLFTAGALQSTGRDLDFALTDDDTFFCVADADGVKYTRDGNFSLSQQADGTFQLVSSSGASVLDANGQPITVDPDNLDNLRDVVGVYTFDNVDGLVRDGENCFTATETSGAAHVAVGADIRQGYLEASSVDLASQMVDIIETQRAFQMNARMVQIADEIAQTMNNVR